jgi:transmembrane sensor
MESSTETERRAAEWLAKRDGDAWSDADELAFQRWLDAATANRVAYLRLDTAWRSANRLKAIGAGIRPGTLPTPGGWRGSPYFARTTPAREGSPATARVLARLKPVHVFAASVLIAIAIGCGWYFWPAGSSYRTEVGGLASVPMPDGSRITLNTNSEVRVALNDTERRVELKEGEAFFEVSKDPQRPFVVQAGHHRIVAIGTKFAVRRADHSGDVTVVVTEGRVRVESENDLVKPTVPPAEIAAGNVARTDDAGILIQEKPLREAEVMLSWRSGYLVFRDTLLADAVAEFNRYNTSKIVIEDASIAGIRIGGNFRSTNVQAFVRLLQDGLPIRVEHAEGHIILTRT